MTEDFAISVAKAFAALDMRAVADLMHEYNFFRQSRNGVP